MIPRPLGAEDRTRAIRLFLLCFLVYAWFFGGGGWNQNATIDLTRAIAERGEISIDPFAANTGDRSYASGHVYANKAPGLSFAAVPVWAGVRVAARLAGVDVAQPVALSVAVWIVTVALCATAGALLAATVYLVGRGRGLAPSWCASVALATAFGTPLFAFSTLLFAHVPSACLLFVAFVLAAGGRRPFLAGLAAGGAVAMNYLAAPAAAIVALLLLAREGRPSRVARYLAGAIPPALVVMAYQAAAFGSPFRTPIATMDPRFVSPTARWLGIFELPRLDALFGITLSPYRGLFWVSPFLLLASFGIARGLRRRTLETVVALSVVAWFVVANASFNGWEGGFSFGPRYLIPAVPFLAILVLEDVAIPRLLVWGLVVISCANNFAAVAVDPQPSGSIAHPLRDYLYPVLITGEVPEGVEVMPQWPAAWLTGHTAINPHTIDQAIPFTRHAPGSAASTWASFNVGERVAGPGNPWSVLPPALLILAGWVWVARGRAIRSSP